MNRKSSFPPVVTAGTRLLILGSLPGERSLAEQRYYAHPRNLFWRLVGSVIRQELEPLAYEDRLEALLAAGLGLWDTVASATRRGSLDAAIRDPEHNALAELVESLPELRAVAFNGAASARIGMPQIAQCGLALLPLPSSSPRERLHSFRRETAPVVGNRRIPRLKGATRLASGWRAPQ